MTTIGSLDPYFTSLINNLMTIERQPLERLKTQRDSITVRNAVYQDLQSQLEGLQDLAQELISSNAAYSLTPGRAIKLTPAVSGDTVLTASASSSAGVGEYEIAVTNRAQAQRQASAVQSSVDQALGLSGNFWLGGGGTASASVTPDSTVTAVGTAALTGSLKELGSGTYTLETRDNDGVLEFRLKDWDGSTVSITDQDGAAGAVTTSWQQVIAGSFDTGRGLTIDFGSSGVVGSTEIDYTAAGTSVAVEATDTLLDIAGKINDASQSLGREVAATVVGTQLVLSAANTGTSHTMIYTDGVGLGFTGVDLQSAQDASFSVNNIAFTRSSNTVRDVINGVTLNLAEDADGKSALLKVSADLSAARSAVENFIGKFNQLLKYLVEKTSVTKDATGNYKRGSLADDSIFSGLRGDLLARFMSSASNDGAYQWLSQIGLSINDSLQATVSDSDALDAALESHLDDVASLLDAMMGGFDTQLGRFTGTSGYMTSAMSSLSSQVTDLNEDIDSLTGRLSDREASLQSQYAEIQAQLTTMSYMQQMWSSIYSTGSVSRYI